MKQYRLEFDWLTYEKGHIWETQPSGVIHSDLAQFNQRTIELLVKSGALSLVEEVELPEKLPVYIGGAGGGGGIPASPGNLHLAGKINEIINYLKANRK